MKQTVLPTIRHLVEVDDLRSGRDGDIEAGQEPIAEQIAGELAEHIKSHQIKKLAFICSPKKRALTTARLTAQFLQAKDPKVEIQYYKEPNLQDINHGNYIVPDEYKAGDFFEGFALADKIFYDEVFGEVDDTTENLTYRYGDPHRLKDGSYQYPELAKYFSRPGENFKEALIRIYGEVVKFTSHYGLYFKDHEPVVFSHGLPLEIYKDLAEVAEKTVTQDFAFPAGKLARVCYQHHMARNSEKGSHGRTDFLALEHITSKRFLKVLNDELAYLKNLPAK